MTKYFNPTIAKPSLAREKFRRQQLFLVSLAVFVSVGTSATCVSGRDVRFEAAAEVLVKNCVRCHCPPEGKAGLDLTTRERMLTGGDNGPAIVIGEPDKSAIVRRATEGSMPPLTDGPQLAADEVQKLRDWIAAGATWPAGRVLAATSSSTSGLTNECSRGQPLTRDESAGPRTRASRLPETRKRAGAKVQRQIANRKAARRHN